VLARKVKATKLSVFLRVKLQGLANTIECMAIRETALIVFVDGGSQGRRLRIEPLLLGLPGSN
jgi:hypothetical protein